MLRGSRNHRCRCLMGMLSVSMGVLGPGQAIAESPSTTSAPAAAEGIDYRSVFQSGQEESSDWLTDDGNVVELKLAHQERGGVDAGVLRLDRAKRVLIWEGAGGPDIACRLKVESKFEDVRSVSTGEGAGLVLSLSKGKTRRLVVIPVPHVRWLLQQPVVKGGTDLNRAFQSADVRGPDGAPMRAGGAAGGVGPRVERTPLPAAVIADTKKAAAAVLEAIGPK